MQDVAVIKSWINTNASPFAWQRILFKLLPEFKKEGFFFHTIQDDSKLPTSLLKKISEALFDTYQIELSTNFFSTNGESNISPNEVSKETLIENDLDDENIIT